MNLPRALTARELLLTVVICGAWGTTLGLCLSSCGSNPDTIQRRASECVERAGTETNLERAAAAVARCMLDPHTERCERSRENGELDSGK